jgi:hypothetical protein
MNIKKTKNQKKKESKKKIKMINKADEICCLIINYALDHNWNQSCIYLSVILHEALNKVQIQNEIKKGYLLINGLYATWHTWIETKHNKYDLATSLTIYNNKEVSNLKYDLSDTLPDKYKRIDVETDEEIIILENNIKIFDKCIGDVGAFWDCYFQETNEKEQFDFLLKFRDDVLSKIQKIEI